MLTDVELLPLGQELARWVRGKRFGEVVVRDAVSAVIVEADGEAAVNLVVVVDDPLSETWPLDDVMAMRRAVREHANERAVLSNVFVTLRPATDDQQEDDEDPGT